MTVREEFEVLRGKQIALKPDPKDVPCHEISDPERLCRNPLVSVRMITYKHERFIRQAVESVMAQVTDFEYELVIGEDASPDRTREICFELQKKYPDKIRVLWSERNVNDIGGNPIRVLARCRGEFYAPLEGDDFWMDSHRLQKQVDAMRANPSVVLCFGEKQDLIDETGEIRALKTVARQYRAGLMSSEKFLSTSATVPPFAALYRADALKKAYEKFEIFSWRLSLGDLQLWRGLAQFGDVYVFHDLFATYRVHAGGVMHTNLHNITIDAGLIRLYYYRTTANMPYSVAAYGISDLLHARCEEIAELKGFKTRRTALRSLERHPLVGGMLLDYVGAVGCVLTILGFRNRLWRRVRRWSRRKVL